MIRRQHVVRDFFEQAAAIRDALDVCFRNPYAHKINWDYFCDPKMYTYLRTASQAAIPQALFQPFMQSLRGWCVENLGLLPSGMPGLHLMVDGCRLGLHSDFHNGTWGYVYSLTRWENRKFSGGETLLLRDGVPSYKRHHVHGESLYELVPAHFNQLLVFDDRIVHGTPVIEGSMDPVEGRIALVGHIRATSPLVTGDVPWIDARKVVLEALPQLAERLRNYKDVQGTLTCRLAVGPAGTVESVTTLTDTLIIQSTGYEQSDAVAAVKSVIHQMMTGLKFPPGLGISTITVPVLIPLPDLRPIDFAVAHGASRNAIHDWAVSRMHDGSELQLQGSWQGEAFVVREPIAGTIRIDARDIVLSFDPPMWVPSQREHFQATLSEGLNSALQSAVRRV